MVSAVFGTSAPPCAPVPNVYGARFRNYRADAADQEIYVGQFNLQPPTNRFQACDAGYGPNDSGSLVRVELRDNANASARTLSAQLRAASACVAGPGAPPPLHPLNAVTRTVRCLAPTSGNVTNALRNVTWQSLTDPLLGGTLPDVVCQSSNGGSQFVSTTTRVPDGALDGADGFVIEGVLERQLVNAAIGPLWPLSREGNRAELFASFSCDPFVSPTTEAPTSDAPTTETPTTMTPTSETPTTDAPTTMAPTQPNGTVTPTEAAQDEDYETRLHVALGVLAGAALLCCYCCCCCCIVLECCKRRRRRRLDERDEKRQ
jgi:hypothetical protein